MAHQIGSESGAWGITNRRKARAASVANGTSDYTTPANYASFDSLDARLTAINAAYYTAARLNTMTNNDKIYAVRLNDDATSI